MIANELSIRAKFAVFPKYLLACILLLWIVDLFTLYSVAGGDFSLWAAKQLVSMFVGGVIVMVLGVIDIRHIFRFSYVLYLSYSGELVQRLGALRLVGLASCVACVLCVGQFVLLRPLSVLAALDADVWWLSVLNASLCTVLPVVLVMLAIARIGSALAAQVGMVGPMSTLAMAALVLDEPLSPWVLAGTALVMAGVFICSQGPRPAERDPGAQVG